VPGAHAASAPRAHTAVTEPARVLTSTYHPGHDEHDPARPRPTTPPRTQPTRCALPRELLPPGSTRIVAAPDLRRPDFQTRNGWVPTAGELPVEFTRTTIQRSTEPVGGWTYEGAVHVTHSLLDRPGGAAGATNYARRALGARCLRVVVRRIDGERVDVVVSFAAASNGRPPSTHSTLFASVRRRSAPIQSVGLAVRPRTPHSRSTTSRRTRPAISAPLAL
jgi:hypothetical protein